MGKLPAQKAVSVGQKKRKPAPHEADRWSIESKGSRELTIAWSGATRLNHQSRR